MRRFLLASVFGLGLSSVAVDASAEPPTSHEYINERPSGFWTSNQPAVNGAYRYRLLGIGCGICLVTGLLTWRLVRKANAARAARNSA